RGLVIGPDFVLGRGKEGKIAVLRSLGVELGFTVGSVSPLISAGRVVSSTAIRQALAQGDVAEASRLLGRPFVLKGQVVRGEAIGRKLGFPTANLAVNSNQALPADGVYATRAYANDQVLKSVTNIGLRPTFGVHERAVEVFLLDFSGDLYDKELRIELVGYLRPEKRFNSPAELQSQIQQDVEQTRALLK
ncbi:MAG: riboflavin kinase, partial [Chloroflexota bacterium]|nr:riboflavin kinase [Chloroflexota bacterium]